MDDNQFRHLLQHFGLSWKGYRKVRKGVKKRISRHMKNLKCRNIQEYLSVLEKNDEEKQECGRLMTVSISRFFRDRRLWFTLQKKILPRLIEHQDETFKVWSAGSACGEEVYSFKIVWNQLQSDIPQLPKLEITATDMNPVYLDRAKAGVYGSSSLKEVQREFIPAYFDITSGETRYAVKPSLKNGIIWKLHQLQADPPGSDFHVIFLRNNLLTYYQNRLKTAAFMNILHGLRPFGCLIIGSHEKLPFETTALVPFEDYSYVFRKQTVGSIYRHRKL